MDDGRYLKKQMEDLQAHEALCKQCGECCGAFGSDPCANLIKREDGRYHCAVYENRLGPQKTAGGVIFTCVRIRDVHKHGVFYNNCAYNR